MDGSHSRRVEVSPHVRHHALFQKRSGLITETSDIVTNPMRSRIAANRCSAIGFAKLKEIDNRKSYDQFY